MTKTEYEINAFLTVREQDREFYINTKLGDSETPEYKGKEMETPLESGARNLRALKKLWDKVKTAVKSNWNSSSVTSHFEFSNSVELRRFHPG